MEKALESLEVTLESDAIFIEPKSDCEQVSPEPHLITYSGLI